LTKLLHKAQPAFEAFRRPWTTASNRKQAQVDARKTKGLRQLWLVQVIQNKRLIYYRRRLSSPRIRYLLLSSLNDSAQRRCLGSLVPGTAPECGQKQYGRQRQHPKIVIHDSRSYCVRNDYAAASTNQSGNTDVRIQVHYRGTLGPGHFFLASSFDRAIEKLEEALDYSSAGREVWFWGVDRAKTWFLGGISERSRVAVGRRMNSPEGTSVSLTPEREVPLRPRPSAGPGGIRRNAREFSRSTRRQLTLTLLF